VTKLRCTDCNILFHKLCEGLRTDDVDDDDIVQHFKCSRCLAAAGALLPDEEPEVEP
jgi:uncharacterized protein YfiM (DUF2279 family)